MTVVRSYRKRSPEAARRRKLRSKYGLTPEEYQRLLDAQGGACAICGQPEEKLLVDHNHATGAVRGLLCRSCNLALGYVHDDPSILLSAVRYLTDPTDGVAAA